MAKATVTYENPVTNVELTPEELEYLTALVGKVSFTDSLDNLYEELRRALDEVLEDNAWPELKKWKTTTTSDRPLSTFRHRKEE